MAKHGSKVYGKAAIGAPPMSVPSAFGVESQPGEVVGGAGRHRDGSLIAGVSFSRLMKINQTCLSHMDI